MTFTPENQVFVEVCSRALIVLLTCACQALLWCAVKKNPCREVKDFAKDVSALGVPIDQDFVKRVFRRWRFSFKIVKARHIYKFTEENIRYYVIYTLRVRLIPWGVLKFADEASFQSRSEF